MILNPIIGEPRVKALGSGTDADPFVPGVVPVDPATGQPVSPTPALTIGTTHTIALSASSQQTPAFGDGTHFVRVWCTETARIATGTAPNGANGAPVGSGVPEYFRVSPGDRLGAVQLDGGGTLYVTEMETLP